MRTTITVTSQNSAPDELYELEGPGPALAHLARLIPAVLAAHRSEWADLTAKTQEALRILRDAGLITPPLTCEFAHHEGPWYHFRRCVCQVSYCGGHKIEDLKLSGGDPGAPREAANEAPGVAADGTEPVPGRSGHPEPSAQRLASPEEMVVNHESWADYEDQLRQRIQDQIFDAAATWQEDFGGVPGEVVSVRDAAAVITWWVRDNFNRDRYKPPTLSPQKAYEILNRIDMEAADYRFKRHLSASHGELQLVIGSSCMPIFREAFTVLPGVRDVMRLWLADRGLVLETVADPSGSECGEFQFLIYRRGDVIYNPTVDLTPKSETPEGCICDRKEGQPGYGLLCPIHGDPISRKNVTEKTLPELLQEMHATQDAIVEQIRAEPGPSINRGGVTFPTSTDPGMQEAFRIAQGDERGTIPQREESP